MLIPNPSTPAPVLFIFRLFPVPFLAGVGGILPQIDVFKENFERTASWQFEIRNLRASIVPAALSLSPGPWIPNVTGTLCVSKIDVLEQSQISLFGPFRPSPGFSREFLNPMVLPSRAACQLRGWLVYVVRSTLFRRG